VADNNYGSISRNTRKEKANHPDIRGSATVNGVEYWVAGWQKSNDKGTYYSLAFTPKEERRSPQIDPDDDSIPF
jgi:hypothetical protein